MTEREVSKEEQQAVVDWYENNSKDIFEEQLDKPAHRNYDGSYDEFFSMLAEAFANVSEDMVKEVAFNLCDHYEADVQRRQAQDLYDDVDGGEGSQ